MIGRDTSILLLTDHLLKSPTPYSFIDLSNNLWHNRLGHPRATILNYLYRNNFILSNKSQHKSICQYCQFRKQIKMSFYESLSHTLLLFDIVHSDLWILPTLSSGDHLTIFYFSMILQIFYGPFLLHTNLKLIPLFFIVTSYP